MERLKQMEEDYAILRRGPGEHGCLMEDVGMCPTCESYMDMAEEIWEELRIERQLLPGYLEAQSRQRMACTCSELARPLKVDLQSRIVALAMLIK